jgi:hypothetical protein
MITLKDIKEIAPTDNLYKFTAVGGIALVVAGLLAISFLNDRINTRSDNLRIEEAKLSVTLPISDWLFERLLVNYGHQETELLHELDAATQPATRPITDENIRELITKEREITQSIAETKHKWADEALTPTTQLGVEAEQLVRDDTLGEKTVQMWFKEILFGACISIWGFFNWYYRLQRPMDKLLQKELTEYQSNKIRGHSIQPEK